MSHHSYASTPLRMSCFRGGWSPVSAPWNQRRQFTVRSKWMTGDGSGAWEMDGNGCFTRNWCHDLCNLSNFIKKTHNLMDISWRYVDLLSQSDAMMFQLDPPKTTISNAEISTGAWALWHFTPRTTSPCGGQVRGLWLRDGESSFSSKNDKTWVKHGYFMGIYWI